MRPILEALREGGDDGLKDVAIALLPDHPTPVALRTHTNDPIPFCIYHPGIEADSVETFDEEACQLGSLGLLEGDAFIKLFMNHNS